MKKHNRILIITLLLTLVAAGCKKDNNRIRIFVEPMNGSKVMVDPANHGGSWVAGETVNINGRVATIETDDDGYYIDATTSLSTLWALYPATVDQDGNKVDVTNTASARSITLHSLAVNFHSNGSYDVRFPMAAVASTDASSLQFRHLTAALDLTLKCNTPCTLATVVIKLYGQAAVVPLAHPDNAETLVTTRWAVTGPCVPTTNWGYGSDDRDVKYVSKMVYNMMTDGQTGVVVPADANGLTFIVPATVCNVKRISVAGYDPDGNELFSRFQQDEFAAAQSLERNVIYTIPYILIN